MAGFSVEDAPKKLFGTYQHHEQIFAELVKRGRIKPRADGLYYRQDLPVSQPYFLVELDKLKKQYAAEASETRRSAEEEIERLIESRVVRRMQKQKTAEEKDGLKKIATLLAKHNISLPDLGGA